MNLRHRFSALTVSSFALALPLVGCGDYSDNTDTTNNMAGAPAVGGGGSGGEDMGTAGMDMGGGGDPGVAGSDAGGAGGMDAMAGMGGMDAAAGMGGEGGMDAAGPVCMNNAVMGDLMVEPMVTPVEAACESVTPCGGDITGTWAVAGSCFPVTGVTDVGSFGLGCTEGPATGNMAVEGVWIANADGSFIDATHTTGDMAIDIPAECKDISGTVTTCDRVGDPLQGLGIPTLACVDNMDTGGCDCTGNFDHTGGLAFPSFENIHCGTYEVADTTLTVQTPRVSDPVSYDFCVEGDTLTLTPQTVNKVGDVAGTVVFQRQ